MASSPLPKFSSRQGPSFHLQGAANEARARQTFAPDPRSGSGTAGLRVADLQAGMGSVRSRRYYPAYSIRKQYKSPLRTTHDEEMERRRRQRRETSSWPAEQSLLPGWTKRIFDGTASPIPIVQSMSLTQHVSRWHSPWLRRNPLTECPHCLGVREK